MTLTPVLRRLAVGLLVLAFVSAIAGAGTVGEARPIRVVALGDSVTSGANCGCTAFPQLYAGLLHERSGVPVVVDNLGVAGLDSAGLLQQLGQRTVQRPSAPRTSYCSRSARTTSAITTTTSRADGARVTASRTSSSS